MADLGQIQCCSCLQEVQILSWYSLGNNPKFSVYHVHIEGLMQERPGLAFSQNHHLPDSKNFEILWSAYMKYRRKICPNPLARLVVLLAPGRRAVGNGEPWRRNSSVLTMELRLSCTNPSILQLHGNLVLHWCCPLQHSVITFTLSFAMALDILIILHYLFIH